MDLAESYRRYAKYFAPEFLARQAERLDHDLDVEGLHPATIRTPEGALGTLSLDDSGEVVLAAPFPLVRPFSQGLAAVGTAVPSTIPTSSATAPPGPSRRREAWRAAG